MLIPNIPLNHASSQRTQAFHTLKGAQSRPLILLLLTGIAIMGGLRNGKGFMKQVPISQQQGPEGGIYRSLWALVEGFQEADQCLCCTPVQS